MERTCKRKQKKKTGIHPGSPGNRIAAAAAAATAVTADVLPYFIIDRHFSSSAGCDKDGQQRRRRMHRGPATDRRDLLLTSHLSNPHPPPFLQSGTLRIGAETACDCEPLRHITDHPPPPLTPRRDEERRGRHTGGQNCEIIEDAFEKRFKKRIPSTNWYMTVSKKGT